MTLAVAAAVPECPVGADYRYDAAASDEFEGKALDATRWDDWSWTFRGRRGSFVFSRDNVSVGDGKLALTAREARPEDLTVDVTARGGAKFTTAIVKSKRKCLYGYYECRARTMRAGICNAFWLYDPLSDDLKRKFAPGDYSEEIDIVEMFGKDGDRGVPVKDTCFHTVHRFLTPYLEATVSSVTERLPDQSTKYRPPFDYAADYHVYGFFWTEQELVWYVDGVVTKRRANDIYHRPLHVVFDCEIMTQWAGNPDPADLPAVFSVDYFRRWTPDFAERAWTRPTEKPMKLALIIGAVATNGTVAAYKSLVKAAERAGFQPIIVGDCSDKPENMNTLLGRADALLIGGANASDDWRIRCTNEVSFVRAAVARRVPVLGFCHGHQVINLAFGGTIGRIPTNRMPKVVHRGKIRPFSRNNFHEIAIEPGSRLHDWVGAETLTVNSSHKYETVRIGEGLKVVAKAPDGTVEAIEHPDYPVTGFQFHPETIGDKGAIYDKLIFEALHCR